VEETSCRCAADPPEEDRSTIRDTTYGAKPSTAILYARGYLKETSKRADV